MEPHVFELWHFEWGRGGGAGHKFWFSTGQTFRQKTFISYCSHEWLKMFRHCYAASFSIKTLFCKTNNTNKPRKPNMRQNQIMILKVGHFGNLSRFCLHQQLLAFKKFCMETRLLNISKTTNATDLIKTILKSSCRVLLDKCKLTASRRLVFLLRAVEF